MIVWRNSGHSVRILVLSSVGPSSKCVRVILTRSRIVGRSGALSHLWGPRVARHSVDNHKVGGCLFREIA